MAYTEISVSVLDTPAFKGFVERVEKFVNEYAWHTRNCSAVDAEGQWRAGNPPCDCGYDEAIAVLVTGKP